MNATRNQRCAVSRAPRTWWSKAAGMKNRSRRGGFTMMEVMLGVGLMAILVAVSAVAVVQYNRTMSQLEADGIAKEIYIAAQNHLTMANTQGLVKKDDDDYSLPDLADADTGKTDNTRYLAHAPGEDDFNDIGKKNLSVILPFAAVDESVRTSGGYVIRYDQDTASVMDVFYSKDTNIVDRIDEDELMNGYRDSDKGSKSSERRSSRAGLIGYFGSEAGGGGGGGDILKLATPQITTVDTGDVFKVTVAVNGAEDNGHDNLVAEKYRNSAYENADLLLIFKGETSGAQAFAKLDPSFYMGPISDIVTPVNQSNGGTYTIVLDDIMVSDRHFQEIVGTKKGDYSVQVSGNFLPGENLTIQAVVRCNTEVNDGPHYSTISKHVSSLFDSLDGTTASISSFRHLENLNPDISSVNAAATGGANITKAVQKRDLTWDGTTDNTFKKIYKNDSSQANTDGKYAAVTLADAITTYDGGGKKISGVTGPQGLFAELKKDSTNPLDDGKTVKNLTLVNFNITPSGNDPVGALVGTMSGGRVKNVLAYNNVPDNSGYNITGNIAGGLVGSLTDGTVYQSAAAVYVRADTTAGGLIGTMENGEVDRSYSGGHTKKAKYLKEVEPTDPDFGNTQGRFNVTAYSMSGTGTAGGLIGEMTGTKATVTNSYTTSSVYGGTTAGGFIGDAAETFNQADFKISNNYSTGLVKTSSSTSVLGAFFSRISDTLKALLKNGGTKTQDNAFVREINSSLISASTFTGGEAYLKGISSRALSPATLGKAQVYDSDLKTAMTISGEVKYYYKTIAELTGDTSSNLPDWLTTHYGDWQQNTSELLASKAPGSAMFTKAADEANAAANNNKNAAVLSAIATEIQNNAGSTSGTQSTTNSPRRGILGLVGQLFNAPAVSNGGTSTDMRGTDVVSSVLDRSENADANDARNEFLTDNHSPDVFPYVIWLGEEPANVGTVTIALTGLTSGESRRYVLEYKEASGGILAHYEVEHVYKPNDKNDFSKGETELTSPGNLATAINATANSADAVLKLGKQRYNGPGDTTDQNVLVLTLDDITQPGRRFYELLGDVFTPGEDMIFRAASGDATLEELIDLGNEVEESDPTAAKIDNVLFDTTLPSRVSLNKEKDLTDNEKAALVDGYTRYITSFRHLENLNTSTSDVNHLDKSDEKPTVERASLLTNLTWPTGDDKKFDPFYVSADGTANGFYGIYNPHFWELAGNNNTIAKLKITGTVNEGGTKPEESGSVGLFRALISGNGNGTNATVHDLRLDGVTVDGGSATGGVGAFVGAIKSGASIKLETVLAVGSDASVKGAGAASVGGLVGMNSGMDTTIENSAASVYVRAESGAAGGLIGTNSGALTINKSYTGGHTDDGTAAYSIDVDDSNPATGVNIYSASGAAGGLLGSQTSGTLTGTQSFNAASVKSGPDDEQPGVSGGLVGAASGGSIEQLDNVYAIGRVGGVKVQPDDSTTPTYDQGALFGKIEGAVFKEQTTDVVRHYLADVYPEVKANASLLEDDPKSVPLAAGNKKRTDVYAEVASYQKNDQIGVAATHVKVVGNDTTFDNADKVEQLTEAFDTELKNKKEYPFIMWTKFQFESDQSVPELTYYGDWEAVKSEAPTNLTVHFQYEDWESVINGTKQNAEVVPFKDGQNPVTDTVSIQLEPPKSASITLPTIYVFPGYDFIGWEVQFEDGKKLGTDGVFSDTDAAGMDHYTEKKDPDSDKTIKTTQYTNKGGIMPLKTEHISYAGKLTNNENDNHALELTLVARYKKQDNTITLGFENWTPKSDASAPAYEPIGVTYELKKNTPLNEQFLDAKEKVPLVISVPTPSASDYDFIGWYDKPQQMKAEGVPALLDDTIGEGEDAQKIYSGDDVPRKLNLSEGSTEAFDDDTVAYAWYEKVEKNTITIDFVYTTDEAKGTAPAHQLTVPQFKPEGKDSQYQIQFKKGETFHGPIQLPDFSAEGSSMEGSNMKLLAAPSGSGTEYGTAADFYPVRWTDDEEEAVAEDKTYHGVNAVFNPKIYKLLTTDGAPTYTQEFKDEFGEDVQAQIDRDAETLTITTSKSMHLYVLYTADASNLIPYRVRFVLKNTNPAAKTDGRASYKSDDTYAYDLTSADYWETTGTENVYKGKGVYIYDPFKDDYGDETKMADFYAIDGTVPDLPKYADLIPQNKTTKKVYFEYDAEYTLNNLNTITSEKQTDNVTDLNWSGAAGEKEIHYDKNIIYLYFKRTPNELSFETEGSNYIEPMSEVDVLRPFDEVLKEKNITLTAGGNLNQSVVPTPAGYNGKTTYSFKDWAFFKQTDYSEFVNYVKDPYLTGTKVAANWKQLAESLDTSAPMKYSDTLAAVKANSPAKTEKLTYAEWEKLHKAFLEEMAIYRYDTGNNAAVGNIKMPNESVVAEMQWVPGTTSFRTVVWLENADPSYYEYRNGTTEYTMEKGNELYMWFNSIANGTLQENTTYFSTKWYPKADGVHTEDGTNRETTIVMARQYESASGSPVEKYYWASPVGALNSTVFPAKGITSFDSRREQEYMAGSKPDGLIAVYGFTASAADSAVHNTNPSLSNAACKTGQEVQIADCTGTDYTPNIAHFTYDATVTLNKLKELYNDENRTSVTLEGGGTTVVNLYYKRNTYTLTLDYGHSYTSTEVNRWASYDYYSNGSYYRWDVSTAYVNISPSTYPVFGKYEGFVGDQWPVYRNDNPKHKSSSGGAEDGQKVQNFRYVDEEADTKRTSQSSRVLRITDSFLELVNQTTKTYQTKAMYATYATISGTKKIHYLFETLWNDYNGTNSTTNVPNDYDRRYHEDQVTFYEKESYTQNMSTDITKWSRKEIPGFDNEKPANDWRSVMNSNNDIFLRYDRKKYNLTIYGGLDHTRPTYAYGSDTTYEDKWIELTPPNTNGTWVQDDTNGTYIYGFVYGDNNFQELDTTTTDWIPYFTDQETNTPNSHTGYFGFKEIPEGDVTPEELEEAGWTQVGEPVSVTETLDPSEEKVKKSEVSPTYGNSWNSTNEYYYGSRLYSKSSISNGSRTTVTTTYTSKTTTTVTYKCEADGWCIVLSNGTYLAYPAKATLYCALVQEEKVGTERTQKTVYSAVQYATYSNRRYTVRETVETPIDSLSSDTTTQASEKTSWTVTASDTAPTFSQVSGATGYTVQRIKGTYDAKVHWKFGRTDRVEVVANVPYGAPISETQSFYYKNNPWAPLLKDKQVTPDEGGWYFVGWYDNADCLGDPLDLSTLTMPDRAWAVYAKWERASYIVRMSSENHKTDAWQELDGTFPGKDANGNDVETRFVQIQGKAVSGIADAGNLKGDYRLSNKSETAFLGWFFKDAEDKDHAFAASFQLSDVAAVRTEVNGKKVLLTSNEPNSYCKDGVLYYYEEVKDADGIVIHEADDPLPEEEYIRSNDNPGQYRYVELYPLWKAPDTNSVADVVVHYAKKNAAGEWEDLIDPVTFTNQPVSQAVSFFSVSIEGYYATTATKTLTVAKIPEGKTETPNHVYFEYKANEPWYYRILYYVRYRNMVGKEEAVWRYNAVEGSPIPAKFKEPDAEEDKLTHTDILIGASDPIPAEYQYQFVTVDPDQHVPDWTGTYNFAKLGYLADDVDDERSVANVTVHKLTSTEKEAEKTRLNYNAADYSAVGTGDDEQKVDSVIRVYLEPNVHNSITIPDQVYNGSIQARKYDQFTVSGGSVAHKYQNYDDESVQTGSDDAPFKMPDSGVKSMTTYYLYYDVSHLGERNPKLYDFKEVREANTYGVKACVVVVDDDGNQYLIWTTDTAPETSDQTMKIQRRTVVLRYTGKYQNIGGDRTIYAPAKAIASDDNPVGGIEVMSYTAVMADSEAKALLPQNVKDNTYYDFAVQPDGKKEGVTYSYGADAFTTKSGGYTDDVSFYAYGFTEDDTDSSKGGKSSRAVTNLQDYNVIKIYKPITW